MKNLVIVESPAKAKTIEGFLGEGFTVVSSYGHVRDLEKKNNGVDINNGFKPTYIVSEDKKSVIKELKKLVKKTDTVWLATDEDREGEAISWHLKEELGLPDDTKRIIFHEITKPAILNAIENPRTINGDLAEAQQARRILDRLVGFELSPILWRKIRLGLSAGRVQSVAVRLIVEREREIDAFTSESFFRVVGFFTATDENGKEYNFKAELNKKFKAEEEAKQFLSDCANSEFNVNKLEKKPAKKTPAPPFTTSTLQQEASRKLYFSVARTMLVAQKLYEAGKITYMRTDSVNLSETALAASREEITSSYGDNYSKTRQFKTKSASAQEAHEAIRPTYFDKHTVSGSKDEKALYELIWKRAIASQMSDAELERTTAKISINNRQEVFTAKGEVIKFDGFLKVYLEGTDDENSESDSAGILPPLSEGMELNYSEIIATQRFSRPPARYTEASLVKKLEELGIGRPSTYAPTISTIQKRGYVSKEERQGVERKYNVCSLKRDSEIYVETKTEITGADKNKLIPADIALLVNDFLLENFPNILDYKFTASVESQLDEIAQGKLNWSEMLKLFYFPFHEIVEDTIENSKRQTGERILGMDPKTGKQVSVRMAKYGPVAVLSVPEEEGNEEEENEETKPKFAGLRPGQRLEKISLEEALELFKLPRVVGQYEDKDMVAAIGRFGPYIRHDGKFYSLGKEYDPHTVKEDEAIEVIKLKRKKDAEKFIKSFDEDADVQILNGRWGPYIKAGKVNARIPKDKEPKDLTYEECMKLVEEAAAKKKTGRKKK